MSEAKLRQLVREGKASIIAIHGTPRSGSTIAGVIFAKLADISLNQPFEGVRSKFWDEAPADREGFAAEVYETGCRLIVDEIEKILEQQSHATILVKELCHLFTPTLWYQWIQIPERFLFTIREPHSQYFSHLSCLADWFFKSNGVLMKNPAMMLEKAEEAQTIDIQKFRLTMWGNPISYGLYQWQITLQHYQVLQAYLAENCKKLAVLDSIELRRNPEYAIGKTIEQLGLKVDNIDTIESGILDRFQDKVVDIRDTNRPTVRKAFTSKKILPLILGEVLDPYALPSESRAHICELIPLYLKLLYAPENAALTPCEQLAETVAGSDTWKLANVYPFVAYALLCWHQNQSSCPELKSVLEQLAHGSTQTVLGVEKPNSELFTDSFAAVDTYWQSS